jgi:RNA polymerase sigma factor (sigma-70 family)
VRAHSAADRNETRNTWASDQSLEQAFTDPQVVFQTDPMSVPDLQNLQQGDRESWDLAFPWLWPVAFGAARVVLNPYLPGDTEDVAIESLEELVEKVKVVGSAEELKPLLAKIAHNRAVSRLRGFYATKRGAGKAESIEGRQEDCGDLPEAIAPDDPVGSLQQRELAERLGRLLAELRPPQGEVLMDFFLRGLTYEEIAKGRGVAKGSVGVYLQRGLAALRRVWGGGKDL